MDIEEHLENLRTQLDTTTQEGRQEIETLLTALAVSILVHRNIRDAGSLERLQGDLGAVADAAAGVVLTAYRQSGQTQAALLETEFDELAEAAGKLVAFEHRAIVFERTAVVLEGNVRLKDGQRDLSYVPNYAQVITDAAVSIGSKEGTEQTALLLGALFAASGRLKKMFVRVRSAKEPRAHSKLEGQVINADELWNIGGTLAYGPNDPVLPLRERIFCGHTNLFFIG